MVMASFARKHMMIMSRFLVADVEQCFFLQFFFQVLLNVHNCTYIYTKSCAQAQHKTCENYKKNEIAVHQLEAKNFFFMFFLVVTKWNFFSKLFFLMRIANYVCAVRELPVYFISNHFFLHSFPLLWLAFATAGCLLNSFYC